MNMETKLFLEGLATFDVVFMQLKPGTKRTIHPWDFSENLHERQGGTRIDLATQWLKDGYGVGYLPRRRLGAIDADAGSTIKRIADLEEDEVYLHLPRVYTPSGGLHALFVHPPEIDLERLKNHVCHPTEDGVKVPWDFKLGERTMLVAPGTVLAKGTYRAGIWMPPPALDVRRLAPGLDIYKSQPDFLRDTRSKRDRIMGAMTYLRTSAPISVKGQHSRSVLWTVAKHLVAYYDLDPGLAFHLLTVNKGRLTAWNNRCLGEDGKPHPWDPDELLDALHEAVDATPEYGVHLFQRQQARNHALQCVQCLLEVLTFLPQPSGEIFMKRGDLYRAFVEWCAVDPKFFCDKEFGTHMGKAINAGRVPFVFLDRTNRDGRIYRGINLHALNHAIHQFEQRQRTFAGAA